MKRCTNKPTAMILSPVEPPDMATFACDKHKGQMTREGDRVYRYCPASGVEFCCHLAGGEEE